MGRVGGSERNRVGWGWVFQELTPKITSEINGVRPMTANEMMESIKGRAMHCVLCSAEFPALTPRAPLMSWQNKGIIKGIRRVGPLPVMTEIRLWQRRQQWHGKSYSLNGKQSSGLQDLMTKDHSLS